MDNRHAHCNLLTIEEQAIEDDLQETYRQRHRANNDE
jgi:hypothetical protein